MSAKPTLKVVLCWHMHQPQYRNLISGEYLQPWTYLHTIKDYVDMAAHLEAQPAARAVINFAPILLEQIADYTNQLQGYLQNSYAIRDRILAGLVATVLPAQVEPRIALIKAALRVNEQRYINRFPAYRRLADMAATFIRHPETLAYVEDQFIIDILVWYHLAWLGETVHRQDQRVKDLLTMESGYNLHDRRILLQVIEELLAGIITRYRTLAEKGQVELSMTPYAHPIVPLLLDIKSAREAMPDVSLPLLEHYPGGEERAHWHIVKGIEIFKHFFGFTPKGCWPSEGGVSAATLRLLSEHGFTWTASGGNVFSNSIGAVEQHQEHPPGQSPEAEQATVPLSPYYPYRIAEAKTACFFRDDGLSDLIGFTYSDWHADDAVANLLHHLQNIAEANKQHPNSVVAIILDGENAWEHYPENGYHFLTALYKGLVEHPQLEMTTFTDYLEQGGTVGELPKLVAGSWVYGTFSTWVGEPDKNRGWDMLTDAKHVFDRVVSGDRLSSKRLILAQRQLAICEGSDWFWWFGGDNPEDSVSDFEQLYRQHLTNLYQILGEEPPEYLAQVFTRGHGAPPTGGVMRPGKKDL